jgi:hypothetical protein
MRIRPAALVLAFSAVLVGCGGSSQPAGDAAACRDFHQWESGGGAASQFGSITSLLDAAMHSASGVPGADAKAISNGLPRPPAHDPAGRLEWDLSNVQGDAEGDLSPPDGWSDEVAAVTLDCDSKD